MSEFNIDDIYKTVQEKNDLLKDKDLCAIIDMGNDKYEMYLGKKKAEVVEPEKIKKFLESIDKRYLVKTKFGDWDIYVFPRSELEKYLNQKEKLGKEVPEKEIKKDILTKGGERLETYRKPEVPKVPGIAEAIYRPIVDSVRCIYSILKDAASSIISALKDSFISYKK